MKNLEFILHENLDRFDEDGNILPEKVSTLGYKFEFEGTQFGSYFVINKPSVTVQDIMDVLKLLCSEIEGDLKASVNNESLNFGQAGTSLSN